MDLRVPHPFNRGIDAVVLLPCDEVEQAQAQHDGGDQYTYLVVIIVNMSTNINL